MNRLARTLIVLIANLNLIIIYKLAAYRTQHYSCTAAHDWLSCPQQPTNMTRMQPSLLVTPRPDKAPIHRPLPNTLEGAPQQSKRVLYFITTTYRKDTQKADLVSLCHTLKHVPSLVWIVVENSASQSPVIRAVLERCNISAVHLTVQTPETIKSTWKYSPKVTGVGHRNAGLRWVREHCLLNKSEGVVYFGDDDDKYDLRFFEEIRNTERASVFMVGLTGGLRMEGPYCENRTVTRWHRATGYSREIPIDMQGFAINVRLLLEYKDVWMEGFGPYNDMGYPEANRFLSHFATRATLECRTYKNEVMDPLCNYSVSMCDK